jgi:hypothetical protein
MTRTLALTFVSLAVAVGGCAADSDDTATDDTLASEACTPDEAADDGTQPRGMKRFGAAPESTATAAEQRRARERSTACAGNVTTAGFGSVR